jgi:hypothetical protein
VRTALEAKLKRIFWIKKIFPHFLDMLKHLFVQILWGETHRFIFLKRLLRLTEFSKYIIHIFLKHIGFHDFILIIFFVLDGCDIGDFNIGGYPARFFLS